MAPARKGAYLYDSEVLSSRFVYLLKFNAEKPAFKKRQDVMPNFRTTLKHTAN